MTVAATMAVRTILMATMIAVTSAYANVMTVDDLGHLMSV